MKLLGASLASLAIGQKLCPNNVCTGNGINEIFKQCKDLFPDYISEPNKGTINEVPNPSTIAERNNWTTEFHKFAEPLLNEPAYSNKEISSTLISLMQSIWPFDGWVIIVAADNETGCADYNGISSGEHADTCFNHWYSGCREEPVNGSASRACRNEIAISAQPVYEGKHRIAMAVQVNKAIDHMPFVDKKHVMWWASHAEGCDTIINNETEEPYCQPCDHEEESCRRASIASKFGVSATDLNMKYPEHKKMGAKLIWQHYRQALDKEWSSQNDNQCSDWDVLVTFCNSDANVNPDGNTWDDIAWEKVNIDRHFSSDQKEFEIGPQSGWYGNNGHAQCVTLFVTPFSH